MYSRQREQYEKKSGLVFGMVENDSLGSDCERFSAAELSTILHHSNDNYFSLHAFFVFSVFLSSYYFILRKKILMIKEKSSRSAVGDERLFLLAVVSN